MKNKYLVPLVGSAAIALAGVWAVSGTRVHVAEAAIQCAQDVQKRFSDNEQELRQCERDARHASMDLWEALALFALAGWFAGALGYVAGQRDRDEWWWGWLREREQSKRQAGG